MSYSGNITGSRVRVNMQCIWWIFLFSWGPWKGVLFPTTVGGWYVNIFSNGDVWSKRIVTKRAVIILHCGSLRVGYYVPDSLKMVEIGGEGRIEVCVWGWWAWSETSQIFKTAVHVEVNRLISPSGLVSVLNVTTENVSYPVMGKTCPCVCAGLVKSRGEHTGACELGLREWFVPLFLAWRIAYVWASPAIHAHRGYTSS